MLGHLAIGAQLIAARCGGRCRPSAACALLNCVLSHHGPDRAGRRPGRGFDSPEALALYRLNALDASVKGALEHGSVAAGRLAFSTRRTSWAAITRQSAANSSSSVRSETALEIATPPATPSGDDGPR